MFVISSTLLPRFVIVVIFVFVFRSRVHRCSRFSHSSCRAEHGSTTYEVTCIFAVSFEGGGVSNQMVNICGVRDSLPLPIRLINVVAHNPPLAPIANDMVIVF